MDFNFADIQLIVGLGNVGNKYERTRHNAGFMFVDRLVNKLDPSANWKEESKFQAFITQIGEQRFIKPTTLMNLSGRATRATADYFKVQPQNILIVHDDLDIPLGKSKLQFAKLPKQHNGLESVVKHMGTDKMWYLRLGIENREIKGNKLIPGITYSLRKFGSEEAEAFELAVGQAIDKLV